MKGTQTAPAASVRTPHADSSICPQAAGGPTEREKQNQSGGPNLGARQQQLERGGGGAAAETSPDPTTAGYNEPGQNTRTRSQVLGERDLHHWI